MATEALARSPRSTAATCSADSAPSSGCVAANRTMTLPTPRWPRTGSRSAGPARGLHARMAAAGRRRGRRRGAAARAVHGRARARRLVARWRARWTGEDGGAGPGAATAGSARATAMRGVNPRSSRATTSGGGPGRRVRARRSRAVRAPARSAAPALRRDRRARALRRTGARRRDRVLPHVLRDLISAKAASPIASCPSRRRTMQDRETRFSMTAPTPILPGMTLMPTTSTSSSHARCRTTTGRRRTTGKAHATTTSARTSPRFCNTSRRRRSSCSTSMRTGRDLATFTALGHRATGLEGSAPMAALARAHSACRVLEQNFLALDLPPGHFDGIFANAVLFHIPRQDCPACCANCMRR